MDDKRSATGGSSEGGLSPPHALITKFTEAVENGEGIVELRGFVGPEREDDDAVSLYTSLGLTERILIPRSAIVHVEEPKPERSNEEPTKIYVRGSTELRLITRRVTTLKAEQAPAILWQTAARPRTGSVTTNAACAGCKEFLAICMRVAGSDFDWQIDCISSYIECVRRCRSGSYNMYG